MLEYIFLYREKDVWWPTMKLDRSQWFSTCHREKETLLPNCKRDKVSWVPNCKTEATDTASETENIDQGCWFIIILSSKYGEIIAYLVTVPGFIS